MNKMTEILLTLKNATVNLLAIVFVFLSPIHGMLLTTGLFVVADTIFAVYVAVTLGGWAEYRSGKLFNLAPKCFFYLGSVILAFLVDTFIVAVPIWGIPLLITKIVCGFWVYTEIKSLDETSQKLGNKSFWQVIKELMSKSKSIKKDINDLTKEE